MLFLASGLGPKSEKPEVHRFIWDPSSCFSGSKWGSAWYGNTLFQAQSEMQREAPETSAIMTWGGSEVSEGQRVLELEAAFGIHHWVNEDAEGQSWSDSPKFIQLVSWHSWDHDPVFGLHLSSQTLWWPSGLRWGRGTMRITGNYWLMMPNNVWSSAIPVSVSTGMSRAHWLRASVWGRLWGNQGRSHSPASGE